MDQPRQAGLQIRTVRGFEGVRVSVVGEVDFAVRERLCRALLAAAESDSPAAAEFVLDLSGVTFLDCAGVGTLIAVQRAVEERRIRLTIGAASPAVDRMLALLQLEATFGYSSPAAPVMTPHISV